MAVRSVSKTGPRRAYRRIQRQWKASHLTVHLEMLHAQRNVVNQLCRSAKVEFFSAKVSSASSPKELFNITNSLLQQTKQTISYPPHHLIVMSYQKSLESSSKAKSSPSAAAFLLRRLFQLHLCLTWTSLH